ncbi:hydroxymethylglutaryl-CoA lyase [Azospirillum picis]|uniref:Hydroxymethylglutaryl-CoA lyase n=1 Tax=Azospirillum picis TaxID=488438 RepID=A0ABU0MJ76_9PROT|nr:hydroxymethylglutaryl-CoA lyase [Azospirillum picis]MBP2299692.1 hydroxymethylglutaryl-CoA lyase [Azospirillum picis]MDQ0533488.1 hydroxymethylglutaryl-CoA lyase [Azospirillum picis]
MRDPVTIVEVGLRDGLQILDRVVPTADKLAWLAAEHRAGVRRFEAASFVPPKLLPQMADAAAVVAGARALPGTVVHTLAPNLKGAAAALAAGSDVIVLPLSASEAHSRANIRKSREESVEELARVCRARDESVRGGGHAARIDAGISTAFGCTIQGEVPEDEVVRLCEACLEAGADRVALADTVGYADPAQVRRLYTRVKAVAGDRLQGAHFHDTRGLGLANVLAVLDLGIREFDSSLGGLGGCPHAPGASGNVATEDLAFMLESMGFDTGIDLEALIEAQRLLAAILPGQPLHGKIAAAGLPKSFRSPVHA